VKSRNVQTLNISPTPFLVRYESSENAFVMKVTLDMKLKDVRDTEYPALDVFSLSTKALRENCLNTLREQGYENNNTLIIA
jgi:hypothetical protein